MSAAKRVQRYIDAIDEEEVAHSFSNGIVHVLSRKDLQTLVRKAEAGNKLATSVAKLGKLRIPVGSFGLHTSGKDDIVTVMQAVGDNLKKYKAVR